MRDVFKAIADPTRREILMMLAQEPSSVNVIAEKFEMTRPAVAKHLKVLVECQLVVMETDATDGRQRNCFAQLDALQEVDAYLRALEQFWRGKLNRLGKFLDKKKEEDKS